MLYRRLGNCVNWKICVKYNSDKNFVVFNFGSSFDPRNFLMLDCYNMDEHVECFKCLVYYPVLGEPIIAVAVRSSGQSEVYLGKCASARMLINFVGHRHVNVFICVLNFCGWSQLQNYSARVFQSMVVALCIANTHYTALPSWL